MALEMLGGIVSDHRNERVGRPAFRPGDITFQTGSHPTVPDDVRRDRAPGFFPLRLRKLRVCF